MKKITVFLSILVAVWGCKKTVEFSEALLDERLSADVVTVFDESMGAYGHEIPGLSPSQQYMHDLGDKFFGQTFVTAPAIKYGGLGPIFNNVSCDRCHVNEGRGFPLGEKPGFQSTFLKVAVDGVDEHGGTLPVPGFGIQIQDQAIAGIQPEANLNVQWNYTDITLADGTVIQLRKPQVSIVSSYILFPSNAQMSLRMARPNFGMGLIEAIDENSILKNQDEFDANSDGISGVANYVYNPVSKSKTMGKIGWKAGVANIKTQVAKAFNEDIGVTSNLFPYKNAHGQSQMKNFPSNYPVDVHDTIIEAITFYMRSLSVPARRNLSQIDVIQGKQIFQNVGCNKCHVQYQTTKVDVTFPQISNLVIQPFTDLLLHNMGPGLADDISEYKASGAEWRTPPLWGISLSKKVNGNQFFLHDGRARNFLEAILWHSGEAEFAKQNVTNLSKSERDKLIKFLESI